MKSRISINRKQLIESLDAVRLKGKYKSAHTAKLSSISNGVTGVINDDGLSITLGNASDTLAATCSIPIRVLNPLNSTSPKMFIFEVDMALKYLKTFKEDMIHLGITTSKVTFSSGGRQASVPLLVEHNGLPAITKVMSMVIPLDGSPPTFGKTTFETIIHLEGTVLAQAIKDCNTVGNATYKIDFRSANFPEPPKLTLSSVNFQQTEEYITEIEFISASGEDATLEFSAPLDKFTDGQMTLYLKDDCPILLCGVNRKLIVAPYIRG